MAFFTRLRSLVQRLTGQEATRPPKWRLRLSVEELERRELPSATAGVFDPIFKVWDLRNSNSSGAPNAGNFGYGGPGWFPVVGDWDGNGTTTIGTVDPRTMTWYLKNSNTAGAPDIAPFRFGAPGWIPVVGDWDGNGTTTIGAFDPRTATFYLRNENSAGAPDAGQFRYGAPGWVPVVGDWDGNKTTTIGVFNPFTATWYLRNSNTPGAPDITPFAYGGRGWTPVVGDWDGNGTTTVGVVSPWASVWYLRNSNSPGAPSIAPFAYGGFWQIPVAGNWLGTGTGIQPPIPPVLPVSATFSNSGPVSEGSTATVSFSNQAGGTGGYTYSYDFGNTGTFEVSGSGSATATVPASYTADGPATVLVHGRITDSSGTFTDYTTSLTVNNVAPTVTSPSNLNAYQGASTVFGLGSFTDPGVNDSPWTVTVNWGDSTNANFTAGSQGALNATHTYANAGTYSVTVAVTDKDGGQGTASISVAVTPTLVASAGPAESGNEGSPVTFAGSASGGTAPYSYSWTFGDGTNATGSATPAHTYAGYGSFTATLTVTDASGRTSQSSTTATVANLSPAVTGPAAQSVGVNVSSSLNLGSFSDPGTNDGPWSVTVNWGDSSTPTSFTATTEGSLGAQTHTYTATGNYTLTVTVTDSGGAQGSAMASVAVSSTTLQTVTLDGTSYALVNSPVAFSLSNPNQAPAGDSFTYSWTFGDGAMATTSTVTTSHAYAAAGTYTATVSVSDTRGDHASSSAPVTIITDSTDPLLKQVVNQSSFSYLGSFALPHSANNWDTAYSYGGLAYRYVNGNLQFFATNHVYSGGLVYEFNYPGISTNQSNLPQAQVVNNWGDIYTGQKLDGTYNGLSSGDPTYGLYYDQSANRLYWNYGDWYNTNYPYQQSMGYSTLNDATGVATGVGAWSLAGRPEKFDRGGVLQIPQWFADRYTGGDALGVGFGGYFSIASSASFGPALAAIAPPNPAVNPDDSSLPNIPLIGYPYNAPDRGHRDPNYTSYYDSGNYPTTPGQWNPANGTGYWTWSDSIFDGGTWIDTPQMQGVLFIAKVGQGNVYYQSSDRHAQSGAFEWMVYNPADLAAVASGAKQQWQIQPQYEWTTPTLPFGPFDQNGYSGDGTSGVGGIVFDPTTNRLYVLSEEVLSNGSEGYPEMYVYQVGPTTSAPQITSVSPQVQATGVGLATTATITFDRAMNPTTFTASTIFLQDSSNNLVSAAVSYDSTTDKATLTPNATLNATTHYTVTVRGGATGSVVQDALGNPLATDFTWSFTTGS